MIAFLKVFVIRPALFCLPMLAALSGMQRLAAQATADVLDRAQTMAQAGRFAEAEVLLEEAQRTQPNNRKLLFLLAKVEGRLGRTDKAVAILRELVQNDPKKPELLVALAIALGDQKNLQSALAEVDAAIRFQPNLVAAHFVRARLLDDLQRLQEADDEYSLVERKEPKNSESLFLHALLARQMSDLPKESTLLQRLIALDPRNDYAMYLLGRSFLEQKKDSEAIAAFRSCIILNPSSKEATYALARALRKTSPQESTELMQRFQSARDREKQLQGIETLANMGIRAETDKNYPEAVRTLKKALELCGGCEAEAAIHRNLGLALCHAGEIDEGAEQLHLALKLNPSDGDAARALQIIGR